MLPIEIAAKVEVSSEVKIYPIIIPTNVKKVITRKRIKIVNGIEVRI